MASFIICFLTWSGLSLQGQTREGKKKINWKESSEALSYETPHAFTLISLSLTTWPWRDFVLLLLSSTALSYTYFIMHSHHSVVTHHRRRVCVSLFFLFIVITKSITYLRLTLWCTNTRSTANSKSGNSDSATLKIKFTACQVGSSIQNFYIYSRLTSYVEWETICIRITSWST